MTLDHVEDPGRLRRLVVAVPTVFVVITVAFFMMRAAPGIPSSRAKAYQVRAMDVRPEQPQSHMATPMITAIRLAKKAFKLWSTI